MRTNSFFLLGTALAATLGASHALSAERTSIGVTADVATVRISVNESHAIGYEVTATNLADEAVVRVSDHPSRSPGLGLTSDNVGYYRLKSGSSMVSVTQVVTGNSPGRYQVALGATLADRDEPTQATVTVVVDADDDGDGISNEMDRCPASAAGARVGPKGCAPQASQAIEFETIRLGSGPDALVLRSHPNNVGAEFWTENGVWGFRVEGTVLIASPLGDIPMYEASVLFEYGQDKQEGVQRIRGRAQVPFPALGPLAGAEIKQAAMAEVGLDAGRNLADLNAPLIDDRQYLFFRFDSGFEATAGPLAFKAPAGVDTTFVLDPRDPFFYFRGEMPKLPAIGKLGNVGIGFSLQGLIPFQAKTKAGLPREITEIDGHLLVSGTIPFKKLALELTGDMVGRFDPNPKFGDSPLAPPLLVQYGGSGELEVSFDFGDLAGSRDGAAGSTCDSGDLLRCFSVTVPLGDASLGFKLTNTGQNAYLNGVMAPEIPLADVIPVVPRREAQVTGLISSDLKKSFITAKGEYGIGASSLGKLIGVQLGDLQATQATLTLDAAGLRIQGRSVSQIHPAVGIGGKADVDLRLSGNPQTWYLRMVGDLGINGVPLSTGAKLAIDGTGFHVNGAVVTPITRIAMAGVIDRAGVNVTGDVVLNIPLGPPPGAFNQAKADLEKAQADVRKLNAEIERQRAIVRSERERDAKRLRAAQAAVQKAQADVNAIQRDIDYNHKRIAQLKREIGNWKAWFDRQPWYNKVWAWAVYTAEAGWRGTEIAARGVAIGTLEASRGVALGVLEVAKQTLRGFEEAAVKIPIDADPRVAGLFAARDTALGILEAAKGVLAGLEQLKGRLEADLHLAIGTAGLDGRVQGRACWAEDCHPIAGGSVALKPEPRVCLTIPVVGGEVCAGF